jgi:hypothetical protein
VRFGSSSPHCRYACGSETPVSSKSVDEDWVVWAFTLLCMRAVNRSSRPL